MVAKRVLCLGACTVLGFVLIAVGVGFIPFLDWVVKQQVEKNVILKNGSQAYNAWVLPPAPVYISFYLFDLVNMNEVISSGAKPHVVQRGPYTYREIRPRENITFHDNGTISFLQAKSYVFAPERSNGTENDTFTGVNLPLLTLGYRVRFLEPSLLGLLGFSLHHFTSERLFQEFTVHDYLWGYRDPLMTKVNDFTERILGKKYFPDTVGLFTGDRGNGSTFGMYNVYTGATDPMKVNSIHTWNGTKALGYWTTKSCNMINGTDGTLFHPYVKRSEKLYMFSPEVCRAAYATYREDVVVKGISLYRFEPPEEMFDDYKHNPDNLDRSHCMKAGILNLTRCMQDAPMFVSQPHFYQAHPDYINGVIGMDPKPEYKTFLDVEPYTGAVMNAAKMLQFNILIEPMKAIQGSEKIKSVIYPLLWANEGGTVTDELAKSFKNQVYFGLHMTEATEFALIGIGGLLLIVCSVIIVRKIFRRHRNAMTSTPDSDHLYRSVSNTDAASVRDSVNQVPAENRPLVDDNTISTIA